MIHKKRAIGFITLFNYTPANPNKIPIIADPTIKNTGWSFLVCFILLDNIYIITARIKDFQLNKSIILPLFLNKSIWSNVIVTTVIPAAAIRPVDAGRRP